MSAKIIGFISEKGGVGKTTACYHIAIALNRKYNKKVLVVDTDYQRGGITCKFIPSLIEDFTVGEVPYKTIYHGFQSLYADSSSDVVNIDVLSGSNNIDIIPGDPRLTRITIDKLPGDRDLHKLAQNRYNHLSVIKKLLKNYKDSYDYILIDTHPEISDLLDSVIHACDYCVSPVKLDRQSVVGVASAVEAIKKVNENIETFTGILNVEVPNETKFIGAMPMMAREYSEDLIYTMQQESAKIRRMGLFTNYVTEGDGIREAARRYVPVYNIDGHNAEKQAKQFFKITKEFIERCK